MLPASLQPLAALFVKAGVSLGGLPDAQRRMVLGLVWAGLPAAPMSERDVNEALKAKLAGVASFLDTDHVALRRWLVDAGWLARDGFGREYRRVAGAALPLPLQPLATAFEGVDTDTIAAATRATHSAERDARQRAWQQRKGEPKREYGAHHMPTGAVKTLISCYCRKSQR
ncbi:MAG: DUF2087 domain-containing protein [Burkholderiaceae bacterium]|nr:DUF2087 domain-containing protein [Burkholderiaceae bacterium]